MGHHNERIPLALSVVNPPGAGPKVAIVAAPRHEVRYVCRAVTILRLLRDNGSVPGERAE